MKGPTGLLIQMVHAMEIVPARMITHLMAKYMGPQPKSVSALATVTVVRHVLTTEGLLGTSHGKC